MKNRTKRQKRRRSVRLPLTDEATIPTPEDIAAARQLARRYSRLLVALMDADEYEPEGRRETPLG